MVLNFNVIGNTGAVLKSWKQKSGLIIAATIGLGRIISHC
jgi:hypothetical protein